MPQPQLTSAGIDAAAKPAELVIDEAEIAANFQPQHAAADAEPTAADAPAGEGDAPAGESSAVGAVGEGGGEPLVTLSTGGAIKGFKRLGMDRQEEQEIKELALQRR